MPAGCVLGASWLGVLLGGGRSEWQELGFGQAQEDVTQEVEAELQVARDSGRAGRAASAANQVLWHGPGRAAGHLRRWTGPFNAAHLYSNQAGGLKPAQGAQRFWTATGIWLARTTRQARPD